MRPTKGIAVDVGCKVNPGIAEFRGVNIETNETLFFIKIPGESTNNIGEFLAAVTGLRYAKKMNLTVYSDSMTAISWVRKSKCKTNHIVNNEQQKSLIKLAEIFLQENKGSYVSFWNNKVFGEIPADLSGNKGVIKITYKQFKAQQNCNLLNK